MMVAALLFSWAGFAANYDLFEKFESGKYYIEEPSASGKGGYTLEKVGDEWWFTLGSKGPGGPDGKDEAGYLYLVLQFDEGEIEDIGFTAVEIEYTNNESVTQWANHKIGMQVYRLGEGEGTNEGLDLPVGKYFLPDEDLNEITGIGIMGLWFNYPGNVIKISRFEGIVESPPYPKFFKNPVVFGDYEMLILDEYSITGYMGGVPPFGTNGGWDWPDADDGKITFTQDAEKGVVLKFDDGSKGENVYPAGTYCAIKVNLDPDKNNPTGRTFSDVKGIKFDYKIEDNDGWCDGYDYAVVSVSRDNKSNDEYITYFADGDYNFVRQPAVYYSLDGLDEAENCGNWTTVSMEIAWFDVDGGEFDNARFGVGDGYTPDLGLLEDQKIVWVTVGLNTWGTYYLNNIELVFEGDECEPGDKECICAKDPENEICKESVKSVVASSVKVFSIPGGIAIQGVESASIFGIDGSLIATAKGQISLPQGVYIVKAGNEVVKAIVK
jgi:hypothetical protein